MSTGWNCCLRKVDCRNGSNRGTWRVVVDGGRGTNDGLCGGDPLQVANRLDDVDRRRVCETRWWWVRWVKMAVGVAAAIPYGSCGGVGG